ncbi:MAG: TerC family protein [Myxococcota bacterium]
MESVGSPALWVGFLAFVLVMVALDLGIMHRGQQVIGARQALRTTAIWVSLALCFGAGMWLKFGAKIGLEFLTGWVIEYSLSVDNIFVFVIIFSAFRIPQELQHRVLFWGVMGALILRITMILAGAALVQRFHAVLYLFGAFLLFTGLKILFTKEAEEEEHPEQNAMVRLAQKIIPTTSQMHGMKFFVEENGRRMATPLFICLLAVEFSDVIFALDSIPAIFAITADPFVVFTSNIFAIMGLRSLYFLLARWVGLFRFLKTGLGIVLSFVGVKMLLGIWDIHIPPAASLGVIVSVLVASIVASAVIPEKKE